jgi:hypothetical protein
MPQAKPIRPQLETLEDRRVPATVSASGGNLYISNPDGSLTVQTTSTTGVIRVIDNSGTRNFGGITNLIRITGNNLDNTIRFTATTKPFLGALNVNSGNGSDDLFLNGRVNGNVQLNTGLGDDSVASDTADVRVGGALTITDTAGTNTFAMNGFDCIVGGAMSIGGLGAFTMGAGSILNVKGNLTLTTTSGGTDPINVLFDGTSLIARRKLTITGGLANDTVSLTAKASVTGAMTFNAGSGNNTFVLTPASGGSGVAGDLTFTGGLGVDVFVLGANSLIGGNTSVSLGSGINTFVDTATSRYHGDLTVTGGTLVSTSNTNTCVVAGQIDGGLFVQWAGGNGNTTVFIGSVGTTFVYVGGPVSTLEVLTIAPTSATILTLDAKFGTGDATLNLGPNLSLTGQVIGSGGTYTFNQGTAILLPTLLLTNFP